MALPSGRAFIYVFENLEKTKHQLLIFIQFFGHIKTHNVISSYK